MEIKKLTYQKTWTNPADFPTYEPDEAKVRQDYQYHPDAVRSYINDTLLPILQALSDGSVDTKDHIDDSKIHVSSEDREKWDGKVWVSADEPKDMKALWVDTGNGGTAKFHNGSGWTALVTTSTAVVPKLEVLPQDPDTTTVGQVWVLDGAYPELRIRLRAGIGSIPLSLN